MRRMMQTRKATCHVLPVLPVVLYNGDTPWRRASEMCAN